jgi:hypothetical protein
MVLMAMDVPGAVEMVAQASLMADVGGAANYGAGYYGAEDYSN